MNAARLERLFNRCFTESFHCVLRGGGVEPLYTPGNGASPAVILYRQDYAASALHEVAHWCIAGKARRDQADYGYWYAPEGRGVSEQRDFERVEARPQALEWIFARACALPFTLSLDNLDMPLDAESQDRFAQAVVREALSFQSRGLPSRAARFAQALCDDSSAGLSLPEMRFDIVSLLSRPS